MLMKELEIETNWLNDIEITIIEDFCGEEIYHNVEFDEDGIPQYTKTEIEINEMMHRKTFKNEDDVISYINKNVSKEAINRMKEFVNKLG